MAGIVAPPSAVTYATTKYGVRGLMESLAMQFDLQGLNFMKTTTIFPYFIETNPDVRASVEAGCKHKVMFNVEESAQSMVDGILRDEEIIVIPKIFYYFAYIM